MILITFDFKKAFDKISWRAIYKALATFNFGDKFIDMIKTLYNERLSCVLNGGFMGDYFQLTRSTRQGDPSSAILFVLVAELLGIKIRASTEIKGLDLNGLHLVPNMLTTFGSHLNRMKTILIICLEILDKFAVFSGLEINRDKSVATILGPLRDSDPKYYMLKQLFWSKGAVKVLGISIYQDAEVTKNINYMEALDKADKIMKMWSHRKLSLMGRITLVNSLLNSQFLYKFIALSSPDDMFLTLQKKDHRFYMGR